MAKTKKSLCGKCHGLCCRYFALPIETPEDRGDYDDIRWYLCHKDITVFVEDGDWYLNVKNKCRHLTNGEHRCTIYKNRPRICRGYKTKDCDLTEGEYQYELHFVNDKQMEEYMKVKLGNNKTEKRKEKRRSSGRRPLPEHGKRKKKK